MGVEQWATSNVESIVIFVLKLNGDIAFNTSDQGQGKSVGGKIFYLVKKTKVNESGTTEE